jgi:hypothetical protein
MGDGKPRTSTIRPDIDHEARMLTNKTSLIIFASGRPGAEMHLALYNWCAAHHHEDVTAVGRPHCVLGALLVDWT